MQFNQDSVLVGFSAHPDDPKHFSGLMMRCLQAGGRVYVIQFTKGEGFSQHDKGLEAGPEMGRLRKLEQIEFFKNLGLDLKNVFFLGLPCRLLEALRTDFFPCEGVPFFAHLLQSDHAVDSDAFKPDLPFFGQAILDTLTEILERVQPTHIVTHHCKDDHPDHRAISWFTDRAVDQLSTDGKLTTQPDIYRVLAYYYRTKWYFKPNENTMPECMGKMIEIKLSSEEKNRRYEICQPFAGILGQEYIDKAVKDKNEYFWVL